MTKRSTTPAEPPLTVGYVRVSTTDQAAGADAQHTAIRVAAEQRGWDALEVATDIGVSGGMVPNARPALGPLLARLDRQGGTLLVARLDRLSRSLADLAQLLDRAQSRGWSLVILDVAGLDMATPVGRMTAGVLGSVAAFERDLIRARTREALAARKAAGVILGRPRLLDPVIAQRIRGERNAGATLQAVASRLNAETITTPTGRSWSPALVRKVTLQVA